MTAQAASGQEKSANFRSAGIEENALAVGVDIEKLGKATAALQAFVDDKKIAGAVMMVSRRGKTVLADSVGLGRLEPKQPMQLDSLFRIYSMTKHEWIIRSRRWLWTRVLSCCRTYFRF